MSRIFDCRQPDSQAEGIQAAIGAVRAGELVVLPTDTVYGIGADAFKPAAVTRLLDAKQRGRDMPVPVLIGSQQTLDGLVLQMSPAASDLIQAFWPGALTVVVKQAPSLAWDLGDTDGTVGVRMPQHPVALEILTAIGPMAVSSANITGKAPADTVAEAHEQLGDLVSVYLEAGSSGESAVSTIVDVTTDRPRVLRLGAVNMLQLREVVDDIEIAETL